MTLRTMKEFTRITFKTNRTLVIKLMGYNERSSSNILLSGTQWVKECTGWSKGIGVFIGIIGLLFGTNLICDMGLTNPPFFFQVYFSFSETSP